MNLNEQRKNHLMENILRQYRLLHEYETRRDLSDRPKEVESANNEIKTIIGSIEDYVRQYDQICLDEGKMRPANVDSIWNDLQLLKKGQEQILVNQVDTLVAVNHIRREISLKLDHHYRAIALNMMLALNEQELRIVAAIIDAIEANQFSDQQMSEALTAIQTGYDELVAKSLPVPGLNTKKESEALPQVWNSPDLNALGKLKLSIPLIPAILSYETELSLNVKQSLRGLWNKYFKGKQVLI